jgi:ribosomal-protein-alanine N-acetyltransferase
MPGPIFLASERNTLRSIEREDIPFLQRHFNDPAIWRSLDRHAPINESKMTEWFERLSEDDDRVALLVCADETPVGYISLRFINECWGNASISYWVSPDEQGQGYGTEAVETIVAYAFEQRRQHKLLAHVFKFNEVSIHLLETVGFEREGVHADEVFVDGAFCDLYSYGLLEHDWRADAD